VTARTGRRRRPDGAAIAYRVHPAAESAPWLVCSNGAGCSDDFWNASFLPALGGRCRVLEWDYRGLHDSTAPADPTHYRVEDHAGDLLDLLAAERIDRAVLLGFSLGVQVTLEAVRRRPEAAAAVALVSGSDEDPLATFAGMSALRPLVSGMFALGARIPRTASTILRLTVGGPLAVPFARAWRFCERDVPDGPFRNYLHRAARLDPIAYFGVLRRMADHSARGVLPGVAVPVLMVAGVEDTMTPVAVMRRMRGDAPPDTEYLEYPGGRHTLLMTRGDRIAERVLAFLARGGILAP
jgi:pimeloyl-ACP methyl ester carboxylesterase